jgi:hypothetical protein
VGGTVTAPLYTPAENTVGILQEAARTGVPVMIAGAWEPRLSSTVTSPIIVTAASGTSHASPAVMDKAGRLRYEREGGGAPSERRLGERHTIRARLKHSVVQAVNSWTVKRRPAMP